MKTNLPALNSSEIDGKYTGNRPEIDQKYTGLEPDLRRGCTESTPVEAALRAIRNPLLQPRFAGQLPAWHARLS